MSFAERPKRHAPKKLDPDFVVDSACFLSLAKSPSRSENDGPPKKKSKLSLDKTPSSKVKSPGVKSTLTQNPGVKSTLTQNSRCDVEASVVTGSPCPPRAAGPDTNTASVTNTEGAPANGEAHTLSASTKPKTKGRPKGSKNKLPRSPHTKYVATSPKMVLIKPHKVKTESPVVPVKKKSALKYVEAVGNHDNKPKKLSIAKGNIKRDNYTRSDQGNRSQVRQRSTELKSCDRSTCRKVRPICVVRAAEKCAGSGHTSRWYHMSKGEHFCNDCFEYFYRSHRRGYKIFSKWKRHWSTNGYTEAVLKGYMADQLLPYWLQCNKCDKWRQVSRDIHITPEYIKTYQCGTSTQGKQKQGSSECQIEEDERVSQTKDDSWTKSLAYTCYLQTSPAAPLMSMYYQDMVGLSAYYNNRQKTPSTPPPPGDTSQNLSLILSESSDLSDSDCEDSEDSKQKHRISRDLPPPARYASVNLPVWSDPFLSLDQDTEGAMTFFPHLMNLMEMEEFPEYSKEQCLYLGLRNLAVILWNINCKRCVTVEQCMSNVICRGLSRVRYVQEVPRVLRFLSRHGYINCGAVSDVPTELKPPGAKDHHVIVIGAGAAGLAAARQLHNYGVKVTVLEAKASIGGRCLDNTSMGLCVGEGAQIINCLTNNPLAVVCHQLSAPCWSIEDRCELFQESGVVTEGCLDRRMDFHFNAMLDNVAEWRKDRKHSEDTDLMVKIKEMHKQFVDETQLRFSEEEEKLLQFHISNLEYACGCCLSDVSSLHWDQNEIYPQFSGSHCIVTEGFQKLLIGLSRGVDIHCNTQVLKVDYSSNEVVVETADGTRHHGNQVIVTVPLAVLQKKTVEFIPKLPKAKTRAIDSLGAGVVEKVALKFPTRFWARKTKGADFFGHVPNSENSRGQFGMFYDMKSESHDRVRSHDQAPAVLVTYLSGNAVHQVSQQSDKGIVDLCMDTIRKLFPEETVPEPTQYFVSHWSSDPDIGMAYTYVPVGCPPSAFLDLAEPVSNKVYFAGEATNRQLPQSVTGAYLSGIREATHILHELDVLEDQTATHCPVNKHIHKNMQQKNRFVHEVAEDVPQVTIKQEKGKRGRKKSVQKVKEAPQSVKEHIKSEPPDNWTHSEQTSPKCTKTEQRSLECTKTEQRSLECTQTEQRAPECPQLKQRSPEYTQTEQRSPECTQTEQRSPECTQTEQRSPECTQTEQRSPECTQTEQRSPECTLTEQRSPECTQTEQRSPECTQTEPKVTSTREALALSDNCMDITDDETCTENKREYDTCTETQDTCTEDQTQDTCTEDKTQDTCTEDKTQDTCTEDKTQDTCTEDKTQDKCTEDKTQDTCTEDKTQDTCTEDKTQDTCTEDKTQDKCTEDKTHQDTCTENKIGQDTCTENKIGQDKCTEYQTHKDTCYENKIDQDRCTENKIDQDTCTENK